jgi:hypothetical protein
LGFFPTSHAATTAGAPPARRENLEDYGAVFLIQLESWEAVIKSGFVSFMKDKTPEPIATATILGWTRIRNA